MCNAQAICEAIHLTVFQCQVTVKPSSNRKHSADAEQDGMEKPGSIKNSTLCGEY